MRNQHYSKTGLWGMALDKSGKIHIGVSYIHSATSREVICKNIIGDLSVSKIEYGSTSQI